MSTDPAQSWDPQQRPWQPWTIEDSEQTWRSLGAIAHGPVVLAQAPGIVVGLRCLFAYPDRLSAWLIATADTAYIPQVLPPRSEAEARVQGDLWEHWPGPADDPLIHATVDFIPQRLSLLGLNDARGHGDGVVRISCQARIFGMPTDDTLSFEVSWGLALPPTHTTLQLPNLRQIAAGAIPFVPDDPRTP